MVGGTRHDAGARRALGADRRAVVANTRVERKVLRRLGVSGGVVGLGAAGTFTQLLAATFSPPAERRI